MSRNLLPSITSYLETASEVRIAFLVRLELSESTDAAKSYIYLTSSSDNIAWGGQTYEAGKVLKVGNLKQTQGLTNYKLNIDIAGEFQEELDRGLVENLDKSYVGKDVEILLAYLDNAGNIIPADVNSNGPMQYFIGDITNIDIKEDITSGSSTVTWKCAGNFQDFEKINGRVTDDASHRGLISQPDGSSIPSTGAKKVSHQTDTGFQHANQTINIATKYTGLETRYKLKHSWNSAIGLGSSKLRSYEEEVEKTLELGVDLAATYLPKIYGVRRVSGIPVFIDTLKSEPNKIEPNKVVIVYAFACGEIDSFLNLYLDGKPIICSSTEDSADRLCLGNQANGDTLSTFISANGLFDWTTYITDWPSVVIGGLNFSDLTNFPIASIPPSDATVATSDGTTHGDTFTITDDSGNRWIQVYHGKEDQGACSKLVAYAAANKFTLQADWASRNNRPASEYWDSNTKLLDTAYMVMEVVMNDEDSTIPELEAVISGTLVDTFDSNLTKSTKQYTLNPVWQALDYILDPIIGGGLDPSLIDYQSFYEVAAKYDQITTSYDDSFLTYWRYLGWKNAPGTNVTNIDGVDHDNQKTLLQTSVVFRTEETVTKNLSSLLDQFDGTINILGGKYHLSVEDNSAPIADITSADIIGSIKTEDLSNKNKWNSIQANIQDPGQGWNSSQISFFNSDYLAKDNGIQKKGNVTFNYITNYYTAREWAQRQLSKSRFSRRLTFNTYFKFNYLYPNANVRFSYARFGYVNKIFRVVSTTLNSDGTTQLVLEDFDETIYEAEKSPDNSGETTPTVAEVLPPKDIEFVELPSARFPNLSDEYSNDSNGLLLWKNPVSGGVLNYQVLNWHNIDPIFLGVPTTQVITDVNSEEFVFINITGLEEDTLYSFKVKTISYTGKQSKYSVAQFNTAISLPDPISFSDVINFESPNADDSGYFTGSSLDMTWDQHTNPNVVDYEIDLFDSTGLIGLRSEKIDNLLPLQYSYTIDKNITDYKLNNTNDTGAYRQVQARIRATNGLTEGNANFVSSNWNYLI